MLSFVHCIYAETTAQFIYYQIQLKISLHWVVWEILCFTINFKLFYKCNVIWYCWQHFSKCGNVANVTIARKKDPARPGQLLSMGYGFVQYYRQSQLSQALKQLQNSVLDDHQLELKRSNRTLQLVLLIKLWFSNNL